MCVPLPLQNLTIDWTGISGQLEAQGCLSYTLPADCLLNRLTLRGPEDEEEDSEEEETFCMDTEISWSSVDLCKVQRT